MSTSSAAAVHAWAQDPRLDRAHSHARRGEAVQAEVLYRDLIRDHADCLPALRSLAALAMDRDDAALACELLTAAHAIAPDLAEVSIDLAQTLWCMERAAPARSTLEALLARSPHHPLAWLMLGQIRDETGDRLGALKAWFQAISRAQKSGQWVSRETTDAAVMNLVLQNIEIVRKARREHYLQAFESVRANHGSNELRRVERALGGFLGELDCTPPDSRQRPKFFYFPDLPEGPYHDPALHPWSTKLIEGWQDIRAEAVDLLREDHGFESFLGLLPGEGRDGYVGGSNPNASWDAFFFYRHGRRLEKNHERCPNTSKLLESIELCRVGHQAPEVCFSVIRPQTTILAHHGVTNTRLVMHLPLIVPPDCALNVIGAGSHTWREGQLMMFDDTYEHEAWNRSNAPRLILLMDCWNPHLTPPEKEAVKYLIEAIDAFES